MKKERIFVIVMAFMLLGAVSGCEGKGDKDSVSADSISADSVSGDSVSSDEIEIVEENTHLEVETSIAYSEGNVDDWSYGNLRKEFPDKKTCYVRVASALTTDKKKYKGKDVTVTYRFTGTKKCEIKLSEGMVEEVDTGDMNVQEFKGVLYANVKKEAAEEVVIFQYNPNGADEVSLDVFYDDQLAERFDKHSVIYFK